MKLWAMKIKIIKCLIKTTVNVIIKFVSRTIDIFLLTDCLCKLTEVIHYDHIEVSVFSSSILSDHIILLLYCSLSLGKFLMRKLQEMTKSGQNDENSVLLM